MRVRALKECFVGNSMRSEGDEFDVPEDTVLFSKGKKKDPVMELVGGEAKKSPPPKRSRPGPGSTDEPGDDD